MTTPSNSSPGPDFVDRVDSFVEFTDPPPQPAAGELKPSQAAPGALLFTDRVDEFFEFHDSPASPPPVAEASGATDPTPAVPPTSVG